MVSVVILALQTVLQSQVMRTSPECRLILAILIEVLCSMTSLHPIRPKKSLKNRKNQKSLEGQKENSGISTPKIHLTVTLNRLFQWIKSFPLIIKKLSVDTQVLWQAAVVVPMVKHHTHSGFYLYMSYFVHSSNGQRNFPFQLISLFLAIIWNGSILTKSRNWSLNNRLRLSAC